MGPEHRVLTSKIVWKLRCCSLLILCQLSSSWHRVLSGFFLVVFGYACLPMCMHRFNQKFCLVVLEGSVLVSSAPVEMTDLLSRGTVGASGKSSAGRPPPLLSWKPHLKAIPQWRYISQLTVSGRPLSLSASGDVMGTDIWFPYDLQRRTKLKFLSGCPKRLTSTLRGHWMCRLLVHMLEASCVSNMTLTLSGQG